MATCRFAIPSPDIRSRNIADSFSVAIELHWGKERRLAMSASSSTNDPRKQPLADAQKDTGRQDLVAPPPTTEKSDPTPVDIRRGQRVWLGFMLVAVIFVAVIIVVLVTN
jgi:hypothetical protein